MVRRPTSVYYKKAIVMKAILLVMSSFILSCSPKIQFGKVYSYSNSDVYYRLTLCHNSIYKLLWKSGLANGICQGQCQIHKKSIKLSYSSSTPDIRVVSTKAANNGMYTVALLDLKENPLGYGVLKINDTIELMTDLDGISLIDSSILVRKIEVFYLGNSSIWKADSIAGNIEVRYDFSKQMNCFFESAKILMRANHLLLLRNGYNPIVLRK